MQRKDQFEWAVDTLVKAFYKGTLTKVDSCGCAVGNLVCRGMGYKMGDMGSMGLGYVLPCWRDDKGRIHLPKYTTYGGYGDTEEKRLQEQSTGYTPSELLKIEHAFEFAGIEGSFNSIQSQFNGLMAVLDVLFEIHEVGADERPSYQAKFSRHPELV